MSAFHSAPAYHGFSPTPLRTFTLSTRPAATYARPATSVPCFLSTPVGRARSAPVVNHYHTGSGMSVGEALLLHQALSQGHSSSTARTSYGLQRDTDPDGEELEATPASSGHFWRNTGLFLVVAGVGFGVYRYWRSQRQPSQFG